MPLLAWAAIIAVGITILLSGYFYLKQLIKDAIRDYREEAIKRRRDDDSYFTDILQELKGIRLFNKNFF